MNSIQRVIITLSILLVVNCQSNNFRSDQKSSSEDITDISPAEWNGWKVSLHPDNGYWWIEYKDLPKRVYISKKRGILFVKYYSQNCWRKVPLSELAFSEGMDQTLEFLKSPDFNRKIKWLVNNNIYYLNSNTDSLQFQSPKTNMEIIIQGDSIIRKEWNCVNK